MIRVLLGLLLTWSLFNFTFVENSSVEYKLYVFEGSDWCTNCKRLDKKILKDSSFTDFLNQQRIQVIKLDFPQRKKLSQEQRNQNEKLAMKYGFEGVFPTIILSKVNEDLFEKLYYKNQSVDEFSKKLMEISSRLK